MAFSIGPAFICATAKPALSENANPPHFRLPGTAVPRHYTVHLTVAPDRDNFTGSVDIDLEFKRASSVLWLNAEEVTINRAELTYGGQTVAAKVITEPKDLMGFSFDHTLGPGPGKFHAEYQGHVSRKDMQGIFQVKDTGRWYVYSQFENIAARRAFPCFDEPSYKVPWQVTLTVPQQDDAFSNTPGTPVTSEAGGSPGMKTVKFAETKPLPSYLVAIAVGPMETVEARPAGANHTRVRIIVPRGHTQEAEYAAAATPDVINLLEKYFGIPYPYDKLDEVAIPLANYAMEHPGLVTYGSGFFLMKPDETTPERKRLATSVMAHELAHQWFGDLVTTAWWDDIWLNEGFASWMANKVINEYHPEWKMNISELNSYQSAMGTDSLVSSRKVRQPVLSDNDIANAFDGITYNKGSALLNMFESYMGPERFQQGIRSYLHRYTWGNATSADFLDSISAGNPAVVRAFSSFLDQAGVPLLTAELTCGDGGASLQLSQQRFLPRGSQGSSNETWEIPVCVRYPAGQDDARQCSLLASSSTRMTLSKAQECPGWVYANAGEAGYYRVLYRGSALEALFKEPSTLSLPERVGLIGDIAALTEGYIPLGEAMSVVPKFVHDPSREVVAKTLSIVGDLDDHLVPAPLVPKYRSYVSDLYKQRAEQLGWKDRPDDGDDARLLRPTLCEVVADKAEDREFIDRAKQLALAWFDDRKAVDPDMLGAVLNAAAAHGDRSLFERMHSQAKKENDENARGILLAALGSFRDPAIVRDALALVLSKEFDPRESLGILFTASGFAETRDAAYDFVKQNWDALTTALPADVLTLSPFVAAGYCDDGHRADAEAFFRDRSTKYAGGPRNLDQALEVIRLCTVNRAANQASVTEFLQKYSSPGKFAATSPASHISSVNR